MVSPNIWGPPIWIFFHTLTVKLKEDHYNKVGKILFNYIKRICTLLPCQECSLHSRMFFTKIKDPTVNSKLNLINAIYLFHNAVNERKHKQLYKYEDVVPNYSSVNLINAYNNFAKVYNTKGNLNQINESFHRQRLLLEFKKWLMLNISSFNI